VADTNIFVQGALARELAVVVGALTASETTLAEATPQGAGHWTATITVSGPVNGVCTIALDAAGVDAVTHALLGETDTPEETIAGTVRELLTQAASAVANGPDSNGLIVEVGMAEPYEGLQLPPTAFTRAISSPLLTVPLVVSIDGVLMPAMTAVGGGRAAAQAGVDGDGEGLGNRIDVILDIELPVIVRFGRTELALRTLTRLSPGSVIDLGRSPDDPVELLVGDRVIARGEVVIVGGNYGVRVLDVVSPSERVRSMEA
jgi:flagellar motor switch protein FliN